ncbi:MAG: bifunctional hydroxymethylpyrimidine kinase/phosphomethylpyrimidine kinase [Chthoniobacterales bacterium]
MIYQPPIVLTIAGSDCSAGAGIQIDLKTFSALGCYGLTAVTCVVAEVPGQVLSIQAVNPEIVRDQIALLFETFSIGAIKTGMLFSQSIINAVADVFDNLPQLPPLVVDPVMIASSGDPLLEADAIEAYRERLFPMATVITPNLDELYFLASALQRPSSLDEMRRVGQELLAKIKRSLLLKGGHLQGTTATDLLLLQDGTEHCFSAPFLRDVETHGTGCTYAAAITAGLAKGNSLPEAVATAKDLVTNAISNAYRWNQVRILNI